jgi:hypothetical protein
MSEISAQRFAIYRSTGETWDANDVDDTVRDGPWDCVVQGCPAVYTEHRSPHQRFRQGSATPDPINGSFAIRGAAGHDLTLTHNRLPNYSAGGRRDTTSRRHIHRLTGLDTPPVHAPAQTRGEPSGITRTQYEYGDPINTAEGMAQFAQAIAEDPSLAISERIRFDDKEYTWDDLAYYPTRESFTKLINRIRSQVTRDRVYFVQGIVKYAPYPDNEDSTRIHLRLMSDPDNELAELWVFMPNSDGFAHARGLRAGQRVDILANALVVGRYRPALSLVHAHQLKPYPR